MARHHFRWDAMEQEVVTPSYSTARGGTLTGQKIEVGRYVYPAATGAQPHRHPNEQIISILRGRLRYRIGDEEGVAEPGDVLYMPPNVMHEVFAIDEDAEIISSKDLVDGRGSREQPR